MTSSLFRAQSFPVEGSDKIACIITGYRGKIAGYESVIQTLNERGFILTIAHGMLEFTYDEKAKWFWCD